MRRVAEQLCEGALVALEGKTYRVHRSAPGEFTLSRDDDIYDLPPEQAPISFAVSLEGQKGT